MFTSKTHLPQVLPAEMYGSPDQWERERTRLILPGWHCVGVTSEIPRHGDFFTMELLGRPLLIRRSGNEIVTLLNQCVHRSSLLTCRTQGHQPEIRCQNHGWTYDDQGRLKSIPGSRLPICFEQERPSLRRYRTELCGQLIFVTLDDNAPPLPHYLQAGYQKVESWFTENWRLIGGRCRIDHVNWKVFIENSLESYHIDTVHPKTFGRFPTEESCIHEIEEAGTAFATMRAGEGWRQVQLNRWVHWLAGEQPENFAFHTWHQYPNLMFTRMGVFSWIECVLPVAPDSTHTIFRLFAAGGARGRWMGTLVAHLLRLKVPFFEQVAAEDSSALPAVQRGLESPLRSSPGLISIREERIFHFQEYVRRMTATEDEAATETETEPTT